MKIHPQDQLYLSDGTAMWVKRLYIILATLGVVLGGSKVWAEVEPLELNHVPLVVSESVPPNVMVSLDDSGSMNWAFIPDGVDGHQDSFAFKSSSYNRLAYNPDVSYAPGVNYLGEELLPAIFSDAKLYWLLEGDVVDIYVAQVNSAAVGQVGVDLAVHYRPPYKPFSTEKWAENEGDDGENGQAAYYYVRNDICSDADNIDDDCYTKMEVGADEQQNFANWYQYYSMRITAGKSVISRAFRKLPASVRVAQQTFGTNIGSSAYVKPFSAEAGGGKEEFYSWLFEIEGAGATKLRETVFSAGEFFSRNGDNNPYWRNPGGTLDADEEELSCRRNFQIMLTDGYYSELRADEAPPVGDVDNSVVDLPDGQTYEPNNSVSNIYSGSEGVAENTLADFALDFWARDLRPLLENNVPPVISEGVGSSDDLTMEEYWNPRNDPATWQHMVNYFIGFGVVGNFDPSSETDFESLSDGSAQWPVPSVDDSEDSKAARIDDLWHGAINSRGNAFSAADPATLEAALEEIISVLSFTESSIAAVDVSGPSLLGDTEVFQASFETQYWTGKVEGSLVSDGSGSDDSGEGCNDLAAGTICAVSKTVSLGSLGNKLTNTVEWEERKVYSFSVDGFDPDPGSGEIDLTDGGIDLTGGGSVQWQSLNADQQMSLIDGGDEAEGQARLDYLLGDSSLEAQRGGSSGSFRRRRFDQKVLGAVVSSSPVYVGNGFNSNGAYRRFYPDWVSPSGHSYVSYIGDGSRVPFVYAAANDGFLHAYDAENLDEQFLYMPSAMFPTIAEYTQTGFVYRPYVDGQLTEGDVYFSGAWQTLLVGAFRGGAKGLFALDISSPENFDEEDVLWEYSEPAVLDDDLGHVYGKVSLIKSNVSTSSEYDRTAGDWLVAFGNGYNSVNGSSVLYLLDPESGAEIVKLDTGIGPESSVDNSLGANVNASMPNGLGAPFLVDLNQDFKVDLAYAGDLYGNMWRFDLRDNSVDNWNVTLVYAAKDADDLPQPITARPMVNHHPSGLPGVMVYFGTGKYLEPSDIEPVEGTRQTFYGIWDRIDDNLLVDRDRDGNANNDERHIGDGFGRSHLLAQNIELEGGDFEGVAIRAVSNESITYFNGEGLGVGTEDVLGWFIDFDEGELIPGNPILRGGNVIFTTLSPSGDLCTPGGSSWIMELNSKSGGPPLFQAFDNNGDYVITKEDLYGDLITAGWQGDNSGVYSDPSIIFNPETGLDLKVVSTSSGGLVNVIEQEPLDGLGRQLWRKLR